MLFVIGLIDVCLLQELLPHSHQVAGITRFVLGLVIFGSVASST